MGHSKTIKTKVTRGCLQEEVGTVPSKVEPDCGTQMDHVSQSWQIQLSRKRQNARGSELSQQIDEKRRITYSPTRPKRI